MQPKQPPNIKTVPKLSTRQQTTLLIVAIGLTLTGIIIVFAWLPKNQTTTTSTAQLITDMTTVFPILNIPQPAYLQGFNDTTFHTNVRRITGEPGTAMTTVGGTWHTISRHHYSKDQPWSADGSLVSVDQKGGSPSRLYLDGGSYLPALAACSSSVISIGEDRWLPSLAHACERINVKNNELMWYDVRTCVKTRTWTLPFNGAGIGMSEGNVSNDGRFIALSDGTTKVMVVDMDPQPPYPAYPNSRQGPVYDQLGNCGLPQGCILDWVSVSASGKYLVVSYSGDHPRVFDIDPSTLTISPRPLPTDTFECAEDIAGALPHNPLNGYFYDLGHADVAINPFDANEDYLIGQRRGWCTNNLNNPSYNITQDYTGNPIGSVVMVRLKDGRVTTLTNPSNEASAHHISTRNLNRPGWVYVGYHTSTSTTKHFTDEIIAVSLDAQHVERFTNKRSVYSGCYDCESHPVPSPDGMQVMFASNWAEHCGSLCGALTTVGGYIMDSRSARASGGGGGGKKPRIVY